MLKENKLKGAAQRYESLPAHEKVSIDRKFEEITRNVELHDASQKKSAYNDLQAAGRDVAQHCYRQLLNGGYFIIPAEPGGNEIKEEPMSEEEQKLEGLVRKIVYDLTIEEAVEFLKNKVDLTKI